MKKNEKKLKPFSTKKIGVNKEPGKFICRKDGQEQVIDLREIGV